MPQVLLKRKGILLCAVLLIILAGIYYMNIILMREASKTVLGHKVRAAASSVTRKTSKAIKPPVKVTKTTEVDMGGGKRKLVVSRDGKKREYLIRSEIWRGYMEVGGPESILGSPTSNEYNWFDGKRQDFEKGHWLYWSEKTGLKMDYHPYGRSPMAELTPQAPIFHQGEPVVEWAERAQGKYFITQDFGANGHLGQDLAISGNSNPGYEVRPIAAGKVVWSGWSGSGSWGYMVLVQHSLKSGRHYYSQYSHLHELPQVLAGQQVYKGTVLGYVGTTGKSTGPHLDLQIKELPETEESSKELSLEQIGPGYTDNRTPFLGNVYTDPQTRIVYYKPSYFINCYNNGSVLDGEGSKTPQG